MAISALGRLTSHPGLKTGLRTRFRDSQPTINWAAKPLNRTIFRRAINTFIAQQTPVRKQALQAHFPASGGPKNPLRKRVALPPAHREHPVLLIYRVRSRVGAASAQWIGIQCIGVHSIPMQFIPGRVAVPTPVGGKGQPNHGVVSLQFR